MIGEAIERSLKDAAYAVDWVRDGAMALAAVDTQAHDLILLDLGLPRHDGHAVLARARSNNSGVPVMIVSAREALDERLRGLDGGADDYVLKPFEMSELLARMRAVIRRRTGTPHPVMSNGVVLLDPATREATVDGETHPDGARVRPAPGLHIPARRDTLASGARGPHLRLERGSREQRRRVPHSFAAQEARRDDDQEREGCRVDGGQKKLTGSLQFRLSTTLSALIALLAIGAGTFSYITAFDEAIQWQDASLRQMSAMTDGRNAKIDLPVTIIDTIPDPDLEVVIEVLGPANVAHLGGSLKFTQPVHDGMQTVHVDGEAWRLHARARRAATCSWSPSAPRNATRSPGKAR